MVKSVVLSNGKSWKTQSEAQAHFLDMRLRHPLNSPITDPEDHGDLLALLERYDAVIHDGPTKIGAGVAHFETRMNRTNGGTNIGFWAVRVDNSETDFSIIKAVVARGSTQAQQFADACRGAIAADLNAAKRAFFEAYGDSHGMVGCEATGARIARSEARADYVIIPIRDIVHQFRVAQGWADTVPDGVITKPSDAQTITQFQDADIASAFRQYHQTTAQIRLVAKNAPASQLSAGRGVPPTRPLML